MADLKWSNLYKISINERQHIVSYIKADAGNHLKLIQACDTYANVAAVVPTVSFATDAQLDDQQPEPVHPNPTAVIILKKRMGMTNRKF